MELTKEMIEERLNDKGELNLSSMGIETLPSWIVDYKIWSLDLSCNKLTNLPDQIGKLKKMRRLNICQNPISILPESFGELKLEELNVSDTQITVNEFKKIRICLWVCLDGKRYISVFPIIPYEDLSDEREWYIYPSLQEYLRARKG